MTNVFVLVERRARELITDMKRVVTPSLSIFDL